MATLSTLELMLLDIQNQENLDPFGDHGTPPELPQRPVFKGRTPPRTSGRAILSFHYQEYGGIGGKKEEFVDDKREIDAFSLVEIDGIGGLVLSENTIENDGLERAEKGIIGIQKCVRGYQARLHYKQLKEGIITLQSLIRGWLIRRRLGYHGNAKSVSIENTKEANCLHMVNAENEEEHVMVSNSDIRDLQRQVLRIESALRNKKHENSNLELQIRRRDRKWELYRARMNLMEKTWQDELTSIQMSLASARERMTEEIVHIPQNCMPQQVIGKEDLTIRQILELKESDTHRTGSDFHTGDGFCSGKNSRKHPEEELRKLKGRFKAWKKDFKARLHEIKRTLHRFDHSKMGKPRKSCCVS